MTMFPAIRDAARRIAWKSPDKGPEELGTRMGTLMRFLDHRERPHDPLGCWLDQWPSLGSGPKS